MDTVNIYVQNEFPETLKRESSLKLLFLLSGSLSIQVGTAKRQLKTHDFTFIMPYELYGAALSDPGTRSYSLDIAPELWKSLCPNAENIRFSPGVLKANDRQDAYLSICKSLSQVLFYDSAPQAAGYARICRAVSNIIAVLLENFMDESRSAGTDEQAVERIQKIMDYIGSNYTRRLSLEELAGVIGFHPQYFSAYFKKLFGANFTDFLNRYRVGKSADMLKDSGKSILSIALACGFNSNRTYSSAFEKVYGCSPREYKRSFSKGARKENIYEDESFDYLRRFRIENEPKTLPPDSLRTRCSVFIDRKSPLKSNTSHNMISVGRAISCLRSDMQTQLKQARREMDLEYVRIRDIFSDDLFVYYEDARKVPVCSWRSLDEILDFLVSIGVKPFIEIGYMPGQMASKKQFAGWQYHPNVSAPKSLKKWEFLVEAFITHLLHRYGKEKVETWLFDFWTTPNLEIQNGYWNESMDSFFRFYESTWRVIRKADSKIIFGSPNFSHPSGFDWYQKFFAFAKARHLSFDFLSTHLYGCGDGIDNRPRPFMQYEVFDNNFSIPNIRPDRDNISRALNSLKMIAEDSALFDCPIIIDDWNITFFPTDYTRDTCFMAPYMIESYFQNYEKVFGMSFSALSDIHEDFFNTDQLFNGGPGIMTFSGIPKASYHALCMAFRFSRRICALGKNYIAGVTDSGYELLLYNMDFYNESYTGNDPSVISFSQRYNVFEKANDLDFQIELEAEEGVYSITSSRISRECGSAYDAWLKMGSPAEMSPEMSSYLRRISTPEMTWQIRNTTGNIVLEEVLEPHSVLHMEITRL